MRVLQIIFVSFFILFAHVSSANAAEFKNPVLVEQLDTSFTQYGKLILSGENFEHIGINITTPQSTENQKISTLSRGTLIGDLLGNKKLMIEEDYPGGEFQYTTSGTAKITAMRMYSIPASYTIPEDAKRYLFPTKNIQSNNDEIRQLAKDITKGAGSDFEKVSRMALWVHSNVNYTLSLGGEAKDAMWVLQNKIGTCDEFSALFIALARSVSIPAKYVSGYVYGDSGWQKHAWAEVYLGKWVSVDATWFEAGRLDATHIKFFETDDNYVANEAKAYGGEGNKITWVGDGADFSIDNFRESVPADYDVQISAEKLSGDKEILVVAKITSDEYLADKFALEPCTGINILETDSKEKKQSVVLEPKKEKILWWKLFVNGNLDNSKIYTCPIVISSNFFKRKTLDFEVDPRMQSSSKLDAVLDKAFFSVGETITLKVADEGAGTGSTIGVVTDGFFSESSVTQDSLEWFSFQAKSPGEHTVFVYDSLGNVVALNYSVQEPGSVSIEKIAVPDFALVNSKPEMMVAVKNGMHSQQNIRLDLKANDLVVSSQSYVVPGKSGSRMNLSIPADSVGEKQLSLRLTADSVEETLKKIRIYDVPLMSVDGKYNSGTRKAEIRLTSEKDEAKNIEMSFGGKTVKMNSSSGLGAISFDVPPGEYDVKVTYLDIAGGKHTAEKKILFRESFFDKLKYWVLRLFN